MNTIWIIGAGRFGRRAAQELLRRNGANRITIVDKNPNKFRMLKNFALNFVCMDGITFLVDALNESNFPDWIVPAIPVHVAYEWIRKKLSERYQFQTLAVPERLLKSLPNLVLGRNREVYFSNADFICPEDCPAPPEFCTYTGKPRPVELFRLLNVAPSEEDCSVVVESRQLRPGVGGYSPQALTRALTEASVLGKRILLSTVCRCHGVMHAFKITD